jgi:hypothetical protein
MRCVRSIGSLALQAAISPKNSELAAQPAGRPAVADNALPGTAKKLKKKS